MSEAALDEQRMALRARLPRAWPTIAGALADMLRPRQPMAPSTWAAANMVAPDGPHMGRRIDLDKTPYLREPLDLLGPESGVNEAAIMKGAQTGFTLMLMSMLGFIIDQAPCRVMVIQPTGDALSDFVRAKLNPVIQASPALRRRVAPQTSRSSESSTTYSKHFPGGSATLALATSAADLRSKTVRVLLRDEIDQYPADLDGQGDPLEISDGRLMSFLASGDWRKLDISTPTVSGNSKIERRYLAGDQRRWHVRCLHCDGEFVLEWGPQFNFDKEPPFRATYVAPCCGVVIPEEERGELIKHGRWIATASRPGAYPSFHFDALSSPFVPWRETAKAFAAAGDDPDRLRTFFNLFLGQPFDVKGDAPDYVRLMERREVGLVRGHVPPRGLLLVAAADVQMRGIWFQVVAFAPNRESWIVEADYIDGSTEMSGSLLDPPDSPNAFSRLLHRTIGRDFPDAFGGRRQIDALGIDSGYRTPIVYATVANNQRLHPTGGLDVILALDGRGGWGRPVMGTARAQDINLAGRSMKRGVKVWPVGAAPLKAVFYSNLRKLGVRSGEPEDPPGYVHFPAWLDDDFFKQITAEYLAEERRHGTVRRVWKQRAAQKDNHQLDCSVYSLALAEYLGLSRMTADEWASLGRRRGSPTVDEAPLWAAAAESEARREEDLERLMKANASRLNFYSGGS